jgi:Ser/Thr protein kinase RdoA (MazF antagonist)
MTHTTSVPTERDAEAVVRRALGAGVRSVTRFPTGLCHYVYDVVTDGGRRVVARLSSSVTRDILAGGVYWHLRLRAIGVPLPALLYSDIGPEDACSAMLLERLPGRDLSLVYADLTPAHKRALAAEVVAVQRRVATLAQAPGFGFARSYDDPSLHSTWLDVVQADLERSRRRIAAAGIVDARLIDRVHERVHAISLYLLAVEPTPFLDDITTKNVLIHDGALSGIVDTDYVCFGDPLFTLALTTMALLAAGHDTLYTDAWRAVLDLRPEQVRALDVYTAVFCVNFLSELGQRFNRDEPAPVDLAYQRRLERILDQLLTLR